MTAPEQKVAVAGLARLAAGLFFIWGLLVLAKGLWDALAGAPEANAFSQEPWQFVTRAQWVRYVGFEIVYGLACLGLGGAIRTVSRRLPAWVTRS